MQRVAFARIFRLLWAGVAVAGALGMGCAKNDCAGLREMIRRTYDFSPSTTPENDLDAHSTALNAFWDSVRARPSIQLPCLRTAVADPSEPAFFRFDGSNLLVSLDSSQRSRQLQVDAYTAVDIANVQHETWINVLAQRGLEGFDTRRAAERWLRLADSAAVYYLPKHGGEKVGRWYGALFLYGSMPESLATPALAAIVADSAHPGREPAIWLLTLQATAESRRVLVADSSLPMSADARKGVRAFLTAPPADQTAGESANHAPRVRCRLHRHRAETGSQEIRRARGPRPRWREGCGGGAHSRRSASAA